MNKEYKFKFFKASQLESGLKEMNQQGWEVLQISPHMAEGSWQPEHYVYFYREIKEESRKENE